MIVVLPWPDKRLTPNAKRRKHWRAYQPYIKADRATGSALTCVALPLWAKKAIAAVEGKIALTVTFYPPDNRRRDDDGMISAFKHMRDGIADALGVDDHRFRPAYVFADAAKPGRVEVEFIHTLGAEQDRNRFPETVESGIEKRPENDVCASSPASPETLSRSAAS